MMQSYSATFYVANFSFYTFFFYWYRKFENSHIREASRMSWNENGIKILWN